ncbi:hypothetical protein EJ06DRAFT_553463 [Trichodelitschia bisporula]|uniref:Uncharacterized protein n=1 Tax=Trichodelitschia bisporula TaxID=703511 RepID=A0A6G1I8L9_9PEZI|nr:hypothetical protein EJ06DRAFT_553463 [Trichodelitschia bisporula]
MSGNFDFPPSSDPNSVIGRLTARFEGLRQTLQANNNREEGTTTREGAVQRQTASSRVRHRPVTSMPTPIPPPTGSEARPAASSSGSSSTTAQSRPRPRSRTLVNEMSSLRRMRQDTHEEGQPASDEQSLYTGGESLSQMNPVWNGLLAEARYAPSVSQQLIDLSSTEPQTSSADRHAEARTMFRRRQNKRVKISHGADVTFPSISYGHFGQVEPGQLKLEIVKCEGVDYHNDTRLVHRVENVLRDDKTIYCAKSSRCNLMFRHQAEALFTLESLVIKAAQSCYAMLPHKGMVFVGMSAEKLIKGAASYHVRYSSCASIPSDDSEFCNSLTRVEGLHDPDILEASRRHGHVGMDSVFARSDRLQSGRSDFAFDMDDVGDENPEPFDEEQFDFDNCILTQALDSEITTAPTPPPPFTIVVERDDMSADGDSASDTEPQPIRIPTGSLRPIGRTTVDSSPSGRSRRRIQLWPQPPAYMPRRRLSVGTVEPRNDANEDELLEPSARFSIYKGHGKVTVKFDPPLSGRFILLKMFSPRQPDESNIVIQHVGATGFVGPRFFPSFQMK